ncbi:MCE family protein [Rhodococcus sp. Q]|uniref:MCE family protein n=1 Tax=Rhodococcus sp. Q TaxID=2502252 RepID=UPI0010F7E561|nr:MCE family protein [Rhodococcus sp. Q]
MMERYSRRNVFRLGIVGTVVVLAIVLAALQVRSLPFVSSAAGYRALFLDAGGLQVGAPVRVAGVDAGHVTGIDIDGAAVAVSFTVDAPVRLGELTRVDIATATVLGARNLRVTPAGDGQLRPGTTIGTDSTTSPYQLTEALGDLTDRSERIDSEQLAESMRVLTSTLRRVPDDVAAAVDGVGRLSAAVAERDDSLRDLLGSAETVTALLAERSGQIDGLLTDANSVLGELQDRRAVLDALFDNVTVLSRHLDGVVTDNEAQLAPTLASLQSVLTVVQSNRDSITSAIDRLGPYITELGEAVSSGPFFNSYIQNLIPGQIIAPFVRAALGMGPAPGDNSTVNPLSALNGTPP